MNGGLLSESYDIRTIVVIITTLDRKEIMYTYEYEIKSASYDKISHQLNPNLNRKITERRVSERFTKI